MAEHDAQILLYPFPQYAPGDCVYYRDGVFQLKLQAAQLLNQVACGSYSLTPQNIHALADVNRRCHEVGLTPLDYPPSM